MLSGPVEAENGVVICVKQLLLIDKFFKLAETFPNNRKIDFSETTCVMAAVRAAAFCNGINHHKSRVSTC